MNSEKIEQFMLLAGQPVTAQFDPKTVEIRKLGAQLLLSEVLEYVVHGLGLTPIVDGVRIKDPNNITFEPHAEHDKVAMLDGLADVAYTMYWNSSAFGLPLEEGFDLVCENNLEKFVQLPSFNGPARALDQSEWPCNAGITWPKDVVEVHAIEYKGRYFAVGKDQHGKVRKPSSYRQVQLAQLFK